MTLDEFKHLTDIHSGDFSKWPVNQVKPALALLATNAQAKQWFDGVLQLDDALRHADVNLCGDYADLETKIMQAIRNTPQSQPVKEFVVAYRFRLSHLFAPSGGLLAMALVGFLIGFNPSASLTPEGIQSDDMAQIVFNTDNSEAVFSSDDSEAVAGNFEIGAY